MCAKQLVSFEEKAKMKAPLSERRLCNVKFFVLQWCHLLHSSENSENTQGFFTTKLSKKMFYHHVSKSVIRKLGVLDKNFFGK